MNMTLETVRADLIKALEKKLRGLSSRSDEPLLCRAETAADGLDPLTWLRGQTASTRIFWSRRDRQVRFAAAGAAEHLISNSPTLLQTVRRRLQQSDDDARYFGGMRFDPQRPIEEMWRPFACCHFVLPRFEVVRSAEGTRLAVNVLIRPGEDRLAVYADVRREIEAWAPPEGTPDLPQPKELPPLVSRKEEPTEPEWKGMVEEALRAIHTGELEKIVLACRTTLEFSEPIDPLHILALILAKNGRTFHFTFQFGETAFVGMSPEGLYRREGSTIYTEAVAATRERSASAEEDKRLAEEMAASDKDLREHRLVKRMIAERLQPLCRRYDEISSETILKLTHVQHLLSEFRGELHRNMGDEQLLAALHPTPAVGGFPQKEAVRRIAQLEPFDRGWYAAPVGWISAKDSEFAVAIRSALVRGRNLHVFAGSGIVEGSDAAKEWQEQRNKAKNYTGF